MTRTVGIEPRPRSILVRGGLAAVLAVLVNVTIVVGVGRFDIAPEFRALTIQPVAFLSALGAVGATVVYWGADQ